MSDTQSTTMTDDATTDTQDRIPLDKGGETTLPVLDLLTGRGFITGKSGSGKSNTASVVVEELLSQGLSCLVVDTDGEYYGLKERYEMLHVGADEECDLQVGSEHAEKLAELALEQNVPLILDVSGYLDSDEASALITETARHLFTKEKKLKRPFLMLVEEVHEYIPEGAGLDETGEMLVKIGKRGRKHGLGLVGISQRPADVKKDFITQCDWLCWHRLTWDNDTKVVRRVIDTDHADAVQDLGDGEAFLMADWNDSIQRVQVRRKSTFDAGATPGLEEFERPDLKSVSGDLVDELEDISDREQRRQDRVSQLENALEEREASIEELQDELREAKNMSEMAERFTSALTSQGGEGGEAIQSEIEEIREEKNGRITELEAENDDLRETVDEQATRIDSLESELATRPEIGERAVEAVEVLTEEFGIASDGDGTTRRKLKAARERIDELEAKAERAEERAESAAGAELEPLEEYEEFLAADAVTVEIEAAKDSKKTSPRYVTGVLASIISENGPVNYEEVAERLGISDTSNVSKAASELERRKIVTKDNRSDGVYVDLNLGGMNEVREAAARREQTEELMENL